MMKFYLTAIMSLVAGLFSLQAQVTTSPTPLQESSKDVTIFFHADQGNQGMKGLPATAAVYAHTGVNLSDGRTWQNAPTWGDNNEKYRLSYVSEDLWQLDIKNIREYYGINDPNVQITQLCFVFRSGDKEGKGPNNTDIFVDVLDEGLQVMMTSSLNGSAVITESTGPVTFNVFTTMDADITLTVNDETVKSVSGANNLEVAYTFPSVGDYVVTATATADGETVSTSTSLCYVSDSAEAPYPGGDPVMGAVRNDDGSVTFCLAAPMKKSVVIVGAWNDYVVSDDYVMNYTDAVIGDYEVRYFWITIPDLEEGKMYGYYYLIDGNLSVGDPYARLVLDPWNDKDLITDVFPNLPEYPFDKISSNIPLAIYQSDINDYDWQVKDFKGVDPSNLIIYELLFRDFTGTEGKADGNGTVRQAMEKLPYLLELGVNAIELLPIMEFNGNNSWGYNPNFYFAVDKAYGTPDDYKEFIDVCHQNGIAVILDMVFNQSDGLHPWYQMYAPGENPFYNLNAPHAYSVLNDWNQGYPLVQAQWRDVIEYWLTEYKFDGFRFDLVKGLGDNDSYTSNSDADTNKYNQSRIDRMQTLQAIVQSINPNAYFINENLAFAQEENAMAETGQINWANVNGPGVQFAKGISSNSNLNKFYAPYDDNRLWGSTVSYLESHDEQRLAYEQNQNGATGVRGNVKVSMQRLGSAAAQMILAPGAHMIWQFSEMGNDQNTKTSIGNDTSPKKVMWSLLDEPNHKALYDSYCELIRIRNFNPELFSETASYTGNCSGWDAGRTMISKNGEQELYTVINPQITGALNISVPFEQKDNSAYRIISKSYDSNPSFNAVTGKVVVPANCYVVIGGYNIASVDAIDGFDGGNILRAYSEDGAIIIDYAEADVYVFSVDGRLMGTVKESGRVELPKGIYVVNSGSESMKLIVR